MRCSIVCCPNVYDKKNTSISFHKFPNNPNVLTAWVAATGISNFIPTHSSKVCSAHFDENAYIGLNRRMLKPDAVPFMYLTKDVKKENTERVLSSDTMACILGTDSSVNRVGMSRNDIPTPRKSVIRPLQTLPAPVSTIKVVDMKKLLQPEPAAAEAKTVPSESAALNSLVNQTGITASHVLNCLRVILPGSFDLSRMIPNEKVVSLVVRYLKLKDKGEDVHNVVKEHLKLIIEGVKVKDKKSVDFTMHPYTKIRDRDLKNALAVILPKNFSMVDITDELLALICITLDLPIYSDAYCILIGKIRKFTTEGQQFSEILNGGSQVYEASLEVEKDTEVNEVDRTQNVIPVDKKDNWGVKRKELVFVDVNNPCESSQKVVEYSQESGDFQCPTDVSLTHLPGNGHKAVGLKGNSIVDVKCKKGNSQKKKNLIVDEDWESQCTQKKPKKIPKSLSSRISFTKVHEIVTFLHEKNYSASDIIGSYLKMFNMCRSLCIRPKHSNIKKIELKLNYIIDNNINVNNVKQFITPTKPTSKKSSVDKLKMTPVVVLEDVLGFAPNELLFKKKIKVKQGFYNRIPFSLKTQSQNYTSYSTDQVKKITDESFKQFRRIILKRDGSKAEFRLKFAKLVPGTVVYAKNYKYPALGWLKGHISKKVGPLKYKVQLDSNCVWACTADQLRPLLNKFVNTAERSHRSIKPTKLFDL